ncbi:MAG: hypothetical protein HYX47_00490 [Burkholderiales bacterium]|nr:hypothetical protein [Burkholderiales bacterium]
MVSVTPVSVTTVATATPTVPDTVTTTPTVVPPGTVTTVPTTTVTTPTTTVPVVTTTSSGVTVTVTGNGTLTIVNDTCSAPAQRAWVRTFMDDQYFWFGNQRAPDESAATIDAYFRSVLFQPTDRYSFVQSTAAFNQVFTEGRRIGFGYTLVWADAAQTQLRVRNVEPLSPIAAAGLKRGDTVLSIDGFTPAQVIAGAVGVVDTVGISRVFKVRRAGVEQTITASSADYAISPVLAATVFDVARAGGNVKVGYLAYQQFVAYSNPAVASAINAFAAAGVQELVLDLRYNGGGSVVTARDLAHMVAGSGVAAKTFSELRFNSKHPENNQNIRFQGVEQLLPAPPLAGLARVMVLTSGATASASELVINGLKPYMNVVTVGSTTYGKPYGFIPRDMCGNNYNAVNFDAVNSVGVGGYINGLPANCAAADDLDHALGDPAEGQTQAALSYMLTGACRAPQAGRRQGGPAPVFGEPLPDQMFLK